MKKRKKSREVKKGRRAFPITSITLIVIGLLFMLNSFSSLTGFVVFENVGRNVSSLIGIVFVLAGILLILQHGWKQTLEGRRSVARKRLVDLLKGRTEKVKTRLAFNIMDRYDSVKETNDEIEIHGRRYKVYEGEVKGEYGGGIERFTIDTAETFKLNLPHGRQYDMPKHIDVQYAKHHKPENIPYREFLEENEDILDKYGIDVDKMLEDLEHRNKKKKK